jgi:hypothetical protein
MLLIFFGRKVPGQTGARPTMSKSFGVFGLNSTSADAVNNLNSCILMCTWACTASPIIALHNSLLEAIFSVWARLIHTSSLVSRKLHSGHHFSVDELNCIIMSNTQMNLSHAFIFLSISGFLESLDDFYLISNGLVMIQTTNNVFNMSLYDQVKPQSILAWQRVRIAHMMSATAADWGRIFSIENSGKNLHLRPLAVSDDSNIKLWGCFVFSSFR